MSTEPQSRLLSAQESQRRFHERIVPRYLAHGVPQERPVLVIVAGQPGAGKSAVENRVHADLGGGTVTIDADDLRPTHPDYVPLALENDRTAAPATHADASRWVEMAKDYCISNRFNVVYSTTMRGAEFAEQDINRFKQAGYRVEVVALAVHEATSRLGVLSRYQQGREDVGFGRYVPDAFQRDAYAGLLSSLDHIDDRHLADAVHIYLRDGTRVYTNELDDNGEWAHPAGSRAAVEEARGRPWNHEEIQAFRDRAAELAHQLPADLHGDLLAIAETAREHVAATAVPPRGPRTDAQRAAAAAAAFPDSTRSTLNKTGQPARGTPPSAKPIDRHNAANRAKDHER